MKLVVLRKHLDFTGILLCRILSLEELFIIIITHLLSKFTSFRCDFFMKEVFDAIRIIKVDIGKVTIIECPVQHD